jgi:DNA-binding winged helix-turn-helix (wHTH) protein
MPSATKRLRFGTFEFDPLTRELRRDGALVRLQPQPSAVLATLLAEPDQVVTRESLRLAVWGSDTHVDSENGLNFCVAQLRNVLGDSAESPIYIKTVPKRGYQFIAPVTEIGGTPLRASGFVASRRFVLPVLAACASGAIWYGWSRLHRRASRPVRIAVARFENQSGDAELERFTDGLSDAVVAEFSTASPGTFEVIGNAAMLRQARDRQDLARISGELDAHFVVLG